jgi:hypothetical protein
MKMGGALEMGYVSSPEEFIPRSGAVHGNMHILGYSTNVMELFAYCLVQLIYWQVSECLQC